MSDDEDETSFYSNAEEYWRNVRPTVDGMLGEYGSISDIDLRASRAFLRTFLGEEGQEGKAGTGRALDCGAGIGRVTKGLLLPLFSAVDMVDVTKEFLDEAASYLGRDGAERVGSYFCCGLQDFVPERGRYDVIWIQWVIGHLTDDHLADFLGRCRAALRPRGLIVIKDNVAHAGDGAVEDDEDSSVCRELSIVRSLVWRAGLRVVREEQQMDFPEEIYQVHTLALR